MLETQNGLRPHAVAFVVALTLGLSGCGGGGGGANVRPTSSPPPTPAGGSDFAGGNVNVDSGDTLVWPADINGSIDLIKDGGGTLVLTGTDSYAGGTTISEGVLQLGNGGTTGSITGDVADNGSLVFDRSDNVTFAGTVSGSGSLTQAGTGMLTLTGNNTYTGGTTISNGTLQLGNGGTTGSITGNVADDGSLVFDHSDNVTFAGTVSGSGSLTQAGTGTLTLTGNSSYTGGTAISAGTLQLGDGGTTGWIAGDVADNGALVFDRSDNVAFTGIVSGSGSLVQAGGGTLTLSGTSTYSGGTTVSSGVLEITSGTPGTGTLTAIYSGYQPAIIRLDSGVSISNHVVLEDATLDNAGTLVDNVDSEAVDFSTASGTILNHDGGKIEGMNAVVMTGAVYGVIRNSSGGVIEGDALGVELSSGDVSNDGVGSVISSPNGIAIRIGGSVENTGGGTISGGSTAIYLPQGGTVTNGSGSTIQTTQTGMACQDVGGCSIFVPATTSGGSSPLTLTNAGTIIGDIKTDPEAYNSATLWAGSSIKGNLDLGPKGILTLQGGAGTVETYSNAVSGATMLSSLSKYGDGTWIIDDNALDSVAGVGVVGGTLQVGNGGAEGSIGQNGVSLYSTLVFDRSDDVVFNGEIGGGGGTLVQAGTGTLTLTADYLSPDEYVITGGTLQIGSGSTARTAINLGMFSANVLDDSMFVFDNGNDTSFSGSVSGTGSFVKEGTGTLTMWGNSTYSGSTMVSNGTLLTMGWLPGDATVGAGSVLGGVSYAGTIGLPGVAGSLANAGTVIVRGGNSSIGGSYTQASTGTLAVSLGSKLAVANTATLNGGTLEITGADTGYMSNTHTNVLTAGNGVSGTFAQLVKDSGVVFTSTTIQYDANNVWLDTTGLNVTTAAAGNGVSYTPASMGSALRVQAAFEQLDGKIATNSLSSVSSDFLQAAGQFQQAPTLQAAQASLQSLSGELHAASAAMTFEAIDASSRALSDRFDKLLGKGAGFGMWTQSLDMGGDMARSGYDGVGFQLNGWLVGNDRQIGRSGVAGFAFGQSQGLQQADQGFGRDNSRSTESMVYAGWLSGHWYTQGSVGFGHFQQDINRQVLLGYSAQGVSTQYGGNYSVAYGESGLYLNYGGTRITPFADVEYASIDRGGFTEQGAGGFGLQSDAQTVDRWQAGLGVRASRHWNLGDGRAVDFSARAQWQRTLASQGDVFDASFVGLQQWQPLTGIGLSRYSGLFGVGLDAALSARTSLNFGYDYEMGQRVSAQMVSARMSMAF